MLLPVFLAFCVALATSLHVNEIHSAGKWIFSEIDEIIFDDAAKLFQQERQSPAVDKWDSLDRCVFVLLLLLARILLLAFRVKIACLYGCSYVVRHNLCGVGGGGIRQKDCRGGTKGNSGVQCMTWRHYERNCVPIKDRHAQLARALLNAISFDCFVDFVKPLPLFSSHSKRFSFFPR